MSTSDKTKTGSRWKKTHCKRGHEYTVSNTYITSQGHRQCRACNTIYRSRSRRKRQEEE